LDPKQEGRAEINQINLRKFAEIKFPDAENNLYIYRINAENIHIPAGRMAPLYLAGFSSIGGSGLGKA
jgi:hypothetical protein